jgi:Flp pilus assembly protein TadG
MRGTNEDGNSLVELAVLMPMLILILAGAAELGRVAYESNAVTNAAYAGAFYGAQNHGTASDTANITAAAVSDGANVAGLTATTATSCTCSDGTTITCANAAAKCASPARIEEFVQVNTSATVNPMFNYPGVSATWVLHGQATLRVVE